MQSFKLLERLNLSFSFESLSVKFGIVHGLEFGALLARSFLYAGTIAVETNAVFASKLLSDSAIMSVCTNNTVHKHVRALWVRHFRHFKLGILKRLELYKADFHAILKNRHLKDANVCEEVGYLNLGFTFVRRRFVFKCQTNVHHLLRAFVIDSNLNILKVRNQASLRSNMPLVLGQRLALQLINNENHSFTLLAIELALYFQINS
jgi:hypothetical protein